MRPVFDYEQLDALLKDFYELTQIRITLFDSDFQELAFVPGVHSPLCQLIRSADEGIAACRVCDRAACTRATGDFGGHSYVCHAGLTEAIIPFYVNRMLAGYLILGQALAYPDHEGAWAAVRQRCAGLKLDPRQLKQACDQSPLVSQSYFRAAKHILHAIASYLTMEKVAMLREESNADRLDRYVSEHYTEPLTAQSLCQCLHIGKTQLYTLSKQLYGTGVAQQIRKLRIDRARRLLRDRPDLSVSNIADDCGFNDYNYFISVFSRMTGQSPSHYRKRQNGGE